MNRHSLSRNRNLNTHNDQESGINIPLFHSFKDIVRKGKDSFNKIISGMRRNKTSAHSRGRRRNIRSKRVGRSFRSTAFIKGITPIALYETLRFALINSCNIREGIEKIYIRGWDKMEKESMTLIFLVDVSRSTYPYIKIFTQILKTSVQYFTRQRDRIGLISIQGNQARIINYPSHNYRIIIKGLKNLQIHGKTPIGDGMHKAMIMAKTEHYKNPDSNPLIIMLSDCYPEPITGQYTDMMDEPIYRDAMLKARQIGKEKINFMLIKPLHQKERENNMPGIRLAEEIVNRSKGRIMELDPIVSYTGFGNADVSIPASKVKEIMRNIEGTFIQKREIGGMG